MQGHFDVAKSVTSIPKKSHRKLDKEIRKNRNDGCVVKRLFPDANGNKPKNKEKLCKVVRCIESYDTSFAEAITREAGRGSGTLCKKEEPKMINAIELYLMGVSMYGGENGRSWSKSVLSWIANGWFDIVSFIIWRLSFAGEKKLLAALQVLELSVNVLQGCCSVSSEDSILDVFSKLLVMSLKNEKQSNRAILKVAITIMKIFEEESVLNRCLSKQHELAGEYKLAYKTQSTKMKRLLQAKARAYLPEARSTDTETSDSSAESVQETVEEIHEPDVSNNYKQNPVYNKYYSNLSYPNPEHYTFDPAYPIYNQSYPGYYSHTQNYKPY